MYTSLAPIPSHPAPPPQLLRHVGRAAKRELLRPFHGSAVPFGPPLRAAAARSDLVRATACLRMLLVVVMAVFVCGKPCWALGCYMKGRTGGIGYPSSLMLRKRLPPSPSAAPLLRSSLPSFGLLPQASVSDIIKQMKAFGCAPSPDSYAAVVEASLNAGKVRGTARSSWAAHPWPYGH